MVLSKIASLRRCVVLTTTVAIACLVLAQTCSDDSYVSHALFDSIGVDATTNVEHHRRR